MSVAELIQQLNQKRNELESSRGIASPSLLKVLEAEIEEMEEALASGNEADISRLIFVDQCAEKFSG